MVWPPHHCSPYFRRSIPYPIPKLIQAKDSKYRPPIFPHVERDPLRFLSEITDTSQLERVEDGSSLTDENDSNASLPVKSLYRRENEATNLQLDPILLTKVIPLTTRAKHQSRRPRWL